MKITTLLIFIFSLGLFSLVQANENRQSEQNSQEISVKLGDYKFDPEVINVKANQPVTLILENTDFLTPHDFVVSHPEAGIDFEVKVKAGKTQTVEFTPTKTGTYHFHCSKKLPMFKSHKDRGMHGQIIVIE